MLPKSPIVWLLTIRIPTISCWRLGAKSPKALRHISSTTTVPVDVTDVTDVTALINHILGTATYPIELCDLNADGIVDVTDVTTIITTILKYPPPPPAATAALRYSVGSRLLRMKIWCCGLNITEAV